MPNFLTQEIRERDDSGRLGAAARFAFGLLELVFQTLGRSLEVVEWSPLDRKFSLFSGGEGGFPSLLTWEGKAQVKTHSFHFARILRAVWERLVMREGQISSEERVSTLAQFVPGSGRLLLLSGGRFVFVAQEDVPFDFSGGLAKAATKRDFFLACIERWFAAGSKQDLVAGVVDADCTAVLAIGRTPVSVQTVETSGLVDPSLANFAAEQMFGGGLVSLKVGEVSPLTATEHVAELCWAVNGLLPTDAFILLPASFSGRSPLMPQISKEQSTQFAEPATEIGGISGSVPKQCGPVPDSSDELSKVEPLAEPGQAKGAAHLSTALGNRIAPMVSALTGVVNSYDDFDEDLDGATVWPTAGRRSSSSFPAPQPVASQSAGGMPNAHEPLGLEEIRVSPTSIVGRAALSTTTKPEEDALSEPAVANPVVDSWEPPAPEPSTHARTTPIVSSNSSHSSLLIPEDTESRSSVPTAFTSSLATGPSLPPASETMTWGGPASNAVRTPEPDSTELTIMASDLARIRRTFVAVAPTGNDAPTGTLLGVYCTAGHFTDSRNQRCLFCKEETDLDTMTSAAAPLLGVLAFDDNRVTPINGLVLVGRKPSTNDPSVTAVAFGEDMMLSRVHFEVRLVDWDVSVVDKQSANGTQIEHPDGRRIVARPNIEVRLEPGSIVSFGNHQATFRRP